VLLESAHGGFKEQVQQHIIQIGEEIRRAMQWKRWKTKRFPLSHCTAAAISFNLLVKFVALGI
jgi:hypothetical protein